jgi:homoserine dehydrogenase
MRNSILVLRFEEAAIERASGLAGAISEIYQQVRLGRPVLAVVRARTGATAGAARLTRALDEAGVPSALLGPSSRAAAADNPLLNARPGLSQADSFRRVFETTPVAVLAEASQSPPFRVALLGLGTVGIGVYDRLAAMPDRFEIAAIAVHDQHRERPGRVPQSLLVQDPWQALDLSLDVVVELIGGMEPAASLILAALKQGCHVVTANKEVLASKAVLLHQTARARRVELKYSASVGGAVPILERLRALAPGSVRHIEGIVNGTCNFILDSLAEGLGFDEALRQARAEGFAEADPTKDLSGADSAHKLAIIARCAFGADLGADQIRVTGIDHLDPAWVRGCSERGRTVRLVARCGRDGGPLRASVSPTELPESDFLAGTRGAENRVVIHLRDGQPIRLSGKGAGRVPTSLAVMADLLELFPGWGVHSPDSTLDLNSSEVSDESDQHICTF